RQGGDGPPPAELPGGDGCLGVEVLDVVDERGAVGPPDERGGDPGEERAVGAEDDVERAGVERAGQGGERAEGEVAEQALVHLLLAAGGVDPEAEDVHAALAAALEQLAAVLVPDAEVLVVGEGGED